MSFKGLGSFGPQVLFKDMRSCRRPASLKGLGALGPPVSFKGLGSFRPLVSFKDKSQKAKVESQKVK